MAEGITLSIDGIKQRIAEYEKARLGLIKQADDFERAALELSGKIAQLQEILNVVKEPAPGAEQPGGAEPAQEVETVSAAAEVPAAHECLEGCEGKCIC